MTDVLHPQSQPQSQPQPPARFNPALLVFLIFPVFGLVIALITGASRPSAVDSNQLAPPAVSYAPTRFVGMMAPDFTINTANGGTFRLSDWRGHIVFLNFWATWCVPCQQEMPAFQQVLDGKISGSSGSKPVIFAVDTDPIENAADIAKFEASLGVHIPAGMDSDSTVSTLYQVIPKPHTFVIDAQGVIQANVLGQMTPDMLRLYLAKLDPAYF